MECDPCDRLVQRALDMSEFFVYSDAKRLKYTSRRLRITTGSLDQCEKFRCCVYWYAVFLCVYDRLCDRVCSWLFSVFSENLRKASFVFFREEISCHFSSIPIKPHIEYRIRSKRKSALSLIIMNTTYPEIIENSRHFSHIYLIEYRPDILKTFMKKIRSYSGMFWEQSPRFCQIFTVSIDPYKNVICVHPLEDPLRMSSESECRVYDAILSGIRLHQTSHDFIVEHWLMKRKLFRISRHEENSRLECNLVFFYLKSKGKLQENSRQISRGSS